MSDYPEAELALSKIKVQILMKSTFFSVIMLSLKTSISEMVPTAGTDGSSLWFNPNFLESLPIEEGVGLMLHELEHVAFCHPSRMGDRAPKKWNQACDIAINNKLDEQEYSLPAGGLIDHNLDNKAAESVYTVIEDPDENAPTPGTGDDIIAPADPDATTHATNELVVKASLEAKMNPKPGEQIPGELLRRIDKLLNPILPWEVILQNQMQDMVKEDTNWSRPNRRHAPQFYLPSVGSPSIQNLTVCVDTSGSISEEEFVWYMTEIEHLRSVFTLERLRLICVDTSVKSDIEITPSDSLLDQKMHGGGGTSFDSVFELLEEDAPTVLLFFTDLEVYWTFPVPTFPVIWLNCANERKAPAEYGETINTKIK